MGNPPPTGYLFVKKIHGTVRVKISIVYFYGNLSETMDVPVEEVSSDYSDDSPNWDHGKWTEKQVKWTEKGVKLTEKGVKWTEKSVS